VRDAQPVDAAAIARIHVESWQGAYQGLIPQPVLDRLEVSAARTDRWQRAIEAGPGSILVAESGRSVIGFAHVGPTRDPDGDPARTGELTTIYLLPACWSQGTGRLLMDAVVSRLGVLGYADATLWVLSTNARARRFYEAGGWQPDGSAKQEPSPGGFLLSEVRYRHPLAEPLGG
jgi:ribosomal protein S18 acetylase RimI-like enzyme